MDSNALLARLRQMVDEITTSDEPDERTNDLAETVRDLDQWFLSGGFLPNDWYQARVIGGRN